ncbi:MAG: TetR/AcrR family transcriptional regulator [Desulfosudaceae bacterium]
MNISKLTTKDKILAAANSEFAEKGFYRAVVSDIADRAGVGKGTVYRHFGNKEDLLGYLVNQGVNRLEKRIEGVVAETTSPKDSLAEIISIFLELHEGSKELNKIIIMEGLQNIGRVQADLLTGVKRIHQHLAGLFQKGITSGTFIDHDPEEMALIFEGLIWSILRNSVLFETSLDRDNLKTVLWEICLNGFTRH